MQVKRIKNEYDPEVNIAYVSAYFDKVDNKPKLEISAVNNAIIFDDFKELINKYKSVLFDMARTGGESMIIGQFNLFDYQKYVLQHYQIGSWQKSKIQEYLTPDQDMRYEEYLSTHKVQEGTIRVSNKWNYDDCMTDDIWINHIWAVGKFHDGKYEIIKKFQDDRFYYWIS